jgi:hypothetical protein
MWRRTRLLPGVAVQVAGHHHPFGRRCAGLVSTNLLAGVITEQHDEWTKATAAAGATS